MGFKTKKDIVRYGVENFIEECQKLVDYYLDYWVKASKRLGLWLDYKNAYQTRHPKYIDSLWSFLKEMWNKKLLYEDLHVVPRCPRCDTALSSHEVAQGYREVEDPSVYFKVEIVEKPKTFLIVWTTTPWTIIVNEAIAVNPNEEYIVLKVKSENWILAKNALGKFSKVIGLRGYEVEDSLKGIELEGIRYIHPLEQLVKYHVQCKPPHHQVFAVEWVSVGEGTGVVHVAPAHGPEDFNLARNFGLKVYTPLQPDGFFSRDAGVYHNLWFQDAGEKVVEDLKRQKLLVYAGKVVHSYPFCWRCGTPLIYYASRQWFLKTSQVKSKMLRELSKVAWKPSWAENRMRDWIENVKDWRISRERFWGYTSAHMDL